MDTLHAEVEEKKRSKVTELGMLFEEIDKGTCGVSLGKGVWCPDTLANTKSAVSRSSQTRCQT